MQGKEQLIGVFENEGESARGSTKRGGVPVALGTLVSLPGHQLLIYKMGAECFSSSAVLQITFISLEKDVETCLACGECSVTAGSSPFISLISRCTFLSFCVTTSVNLDVACGGWYVVTTANHAADVAGSSWCPCEPGRSCPCCSDFSARYTLFTRWVLHLVAM